MTITNTAKELWRDYVKRFQKNKQEIEIEASLTKEIEENEEVFYNSEAQYDLEIDNFYKKIAIHVPELNDFDRQFLYGFIETPIANISTLNYRLDAILELSENPDIIKKFSDVKIKGSEFLHKEKYKGILTELNFNVNKVNFIESANEITQPLKSEFLENIISKASDFKNTEKYEQARYLINEIIIKNDLLNKINNASYYLTDADNFDEIKTIRSIISTLEIVRESNERILTEPEFKDCINKEIKFTDYSKTLEKKIKEFNKFAVSFPKDRDETRELSNLAESVNSVVNYWLTLINESLDAKLPTLSIDGLPEKLGIYIGAAKTINSWKESGKPVTRTIYHEKEERKTKIIESYNISIITNKNVVPNDIISSPEQNLMIITGPNNGGKTTYMRQVGQMYWLAQLGIPLPAKSAEISVVDGIFTSFSGKDDTEAGTGQYLTELNRIKEFAIPQNGNKTITPYSLLFFDEFANGTDHEEAVYRTKVVLNHLSNKGTTSYFTTHKHEISEYVNSGKLAGSINLASAVKVNGHGIEPTHKILRNQTEKSYGYTIAENVGITEDAMNSILKQELEQKKYSVEHTR